MHQRKWFKMFRVTSAPVMPQHFRYLAMASGYSRVVFLVGGYAIKVPRVNAGFFTFVLGLMANGIEQSEWRDTEDHVRRSYLCPVVWNFSLFLSVMRRCRPATEQEAADALRAERAAWEAFTMDTHHGNFGWLDDKLVLVDYG